MVLFLLIFIVILIRSWILMMIIVITASFLIISSTIIISISWLILCCFFNLTYLFASLINRWLFQSLIVLLLIFNLIFQRFRLFLCLCFFNRIDILLLIILKIIEPWLFYIFRLRLNCFNFYRRLNNFRWSLFYFLNRLLWNWFRYSWMFRFLLYLYCGILLNLNWRNNLYFWLNLKNLTCLFLFRQKTYIISTSLIILIWL